MRYSLYLPVDLGLLQSCSGELQVLILISIFWRKQRFDLFDHRRLPRERRCSVELCRQLGQRTKRVTELSSVSQDRFSKTDSYRAPFLAPHCPLGPYTHIVVSLDIYIKLASSAIVKNIKAFRTQFFRHRSSKVSKARKLGERTAGIGGLASCP